MPSTPILQYLNKYGQKADWEIALAMNISPSNVRASLADLAKCGSISTCSVTMFIDAQPVEEVLYRISGVTPPRT
jgi:hypothetical protein